MCVARWQPEHTKFVLLPATGVLQDQRNSLSFWLILHKVPSRLKSLKYNWVSLVLMPGYICIGASVLRTAAFSICIQAYLILNIFRPISEGAHLHVSENRRWTSSCDWQISKSHRKTRFYPPVAFVLDWTVHRMIQLDPCDHIHSFTCYSPVWPPGCPIDHPDFLWRAWFWPWLVSTGQGLELLLLLCHPFLIWSTLHRVLYNRHCCTTEVLDGSVSVFSVTSWKTFPIES